MGDRWVLTAFTIPKCPYELLEPLGFPKPALPAQAVAAETPPVRSVAQASSPAPVQGPSGCVHGLTRASPLRLGLGTTP